MAIAAVAATALAVPQSASAADNSLNTTTPIKHVVVLYDENVSFDHYFGTYPKAANTDGTPFTAAAGTPAADTLASSGTLTKNPNAYAPSRLTPAQALTCDQNHNYLPEQKAVDGGAMDKFVESTSVDTCTGLYGSPGLTMDYYDGNTTTGLWNYAQNYAMSDNAWDTGFGPSTPGALNLISGDTHGGTGVDSVTGAPVTTSTAVVGKDAAGQGTVIADPDPAFDDCSDKDHTSTSNLVKMSGRNIGDLLNTKGVTWGWFQGGFTPTTAAAGPGTFAKCDATTANVGGSTSNDYSPHHNPFAYYASTSNPHHLAPTSDSMIGYTDQANHQYDLSAFDTALAEHRMPAVSFLKAPEAQDGHAAYSDPLDEQKFLTSKINEIEQSPEWSISLVEHRHRHQLRRLGRLVRPRRPDRAERLDRLDERHHGLHDGRHEGRRRRRLPGPLWPLAAPALPGHLAVREAERRRPHRDRADLDHEVHRGQLVHRADRRPVVRRACRVDPGHVRLHPPAAA
jgi:phospholipase C